MAIMVAHDRQFKEPSGMWVSNNGQWVLVSTGGQIWVSQGGQWVPVSIG